MNAKLKEEYTEEEYDEYIDGCCDMVRVGSIEWYPSAVLKTMDPIAYNCGHSEFESIEMTDNPTWICSECNEEYDNEEEAEECCKN